MTGSTSVALHVRAVQGGPTVPTVPTNVLVNRRKTAGNIDSKCVYVIFLGCLPSHTLIILTALTLTPKTVTLRFQMIPNT